MAEQPILEEWSRQVAETLAPLDTPSTTPGQGGRPGLAQDILSFVITGEPKKILREISQNAAVGTQLKVVGRGGRPDYTTAIYTRFHELPNAVALRWARVLEACWSINSHYVPPLNINMPGGQRWPEALLVNVSESSKNDADAVEIGLSAQQMEALLVEGGLKPDALLTAVFSWPTNKQQWVEICMCRIARLVGYSDSLRRHLEAIRPHVSVTDSDQRLFVVKLLAQADSQILDALIEPLCDFATSANKQLRAATASLLERGGPAVFARLRVLAKEAKADQRVQALRLIAALAAKRQDDSQLSFARETAGADNAPSVQALVVEWSAESAVAGQLPDYKYDIPRINWDPEVNRLSERSLRKFWDAVRAGIEKQNTRNREAPADTVQMLRAANSRELPHYTAEDERALQAYLEAEPNTEPPETHTRRRNIRILQEAIEELAAAEEITPVALFKVLRFFDMLVRNGPSLWQGLTGINQLHARTGHPTPLELAQMLEEAGISSDCLLVNYWQTWQSPVLENWPPEEVWPYFAHNIEKLNRALTQDMGPGFFFDRSRVFRALSLLPSLPPTIVNPLFTIALGAAKTDRAAAQATLDRHPGKEQRIIAALSDGKAETRAVAAQWLGKLRDASAIAALETAVAKEKQDLAKGALLDALEALGRPVEKYLQRDSLEVEARKALTKGIPKDLEWFPWQALPEVRWADTRQTVPADILKFFLVQAVKQKIPEPNAVLRKYCAMFEPRDREALGQFVLEAWLQEDTKAIATDEAMAQARTRATDQHQSMARFPQHWAGNPLLGKSIDELTALAFPHFAQLPVGSAVGSKGLLAIASACAAERAAPPVQRYLKQWYGMRPAQGKALIAMLAWIEHPTATQLMLSIGSRFRTKSFQEEATRQAEALADRKGWTLDELADRTVPSGGFDETGSLELSYGQRQFVARLLPDFKIELFNPEGKKIASLPEARQDDDAESAAAAKKTLSAAKKEIKGAIQMQTDRLYEALCTQRQWSFTDWATYLQRHPVLRHLVQRLVWVEVREDGNNRAFRPLDDGTLTDHEDNAVDISEGARIQVAHDSLLQPDSVTAWRQHLLDYEIKSLFTQLGRGVYTLPAELATADRIGDFEGHMIEAFALRGRVTKLGYTRGAAEDGGWFHRYEKRFPTLGLQATIEFSGNSLPEDNRVVALTQLTFAATDKSGNSGGAGLKLARVPATLLSECYQDMKLIAAEGKGHDPDWKKTVGW